MRDLEAAEAVFGGHERLRAVRRDIRDPGPLRALVGDVRPEELYNLAGESSVGASFADPRATWESNAHVVVHLLDAIRLDSPATRFYQASSGEMFGSVPGESVVHDESSALNPQSPYAAAKAAAHMLCRSYRESYGIRIACGILFNHESRRRGAAVPVAQGRRPRPGAARRRRDRPARARQPEGAARLGLRARLRRRDDRDPPPGGGARRPRRGARPTATTSSAPGKLHSVWELADRAFALAGFELDWELEGDDPLALVGAASPARASPPSSSTRRSSALPTRRRSPPTRRASRPTSAGSRSPGLDRFLEDMLDGQSRRASVDEKRQLDESAERRAGRP